MTGPTGLLNFFALEAAEHVDQLDRLLGGAGDAGPDAEAVARAARGLRGAATMAKLTGIAALAAAVERTGRGLRERALPWTPTLRGALVAAVDDLRLLVRNAPAWSDDDERRAQVRAAELLAFGPPAPRAASPTPISVSTGALFVVTGCTDVASALAAAAQRPEGGDQLVDAVRRLRALRGVAAVKDFPPLPEVLDVLERAARPHGARGPAEGRVLEAGARLLRRAADDVRAGRRIDPAAPELADVRAAAAALDAARADADRVVPIAELYPDGEASPVVHAAPAPGTTAAERFRLEAAAAGEHLRRLVADARRSGGEGDGAPLAAAAHTLRDLARSFGHARLADAVDRATAGLDARDPIALSAADAVASLLVSQRRTVDELTRRVAELAGGRVVGALVAVGLAPLPPRKAPPAAGSAPAAEAAPAAIAPTIPAPPTPSPAPHEAPEAEPEPEPMPVPVPMPEPVTVPEEEPDEAPQPEPGVQPEPVGAGAGRPTGRDLHALLESGIAGITRLRDERPAPVPGAGQLPTPAASDVVPVDALLYRGRAALGRAIELRDEIRRAAGPPPAEKLDELFDLLDLAAHG